MTVSSRTNIIGKDGKTHLSVEANEVAGCIQIEYGQATGRKVKIVLDDKKFDQNDMEYFASAVEAAVDAVFPGRDEEGEGDFE